MTPAWPWALALTIALGALIVSQVQLREARGEVHRHEKAWMILDDWYASWLRSITESDPAKAHTLDAHCPTCCGECAGDTP